MYPTTREPTPNCKDHHYNDCFQDYFYSCENIKCIIPLVSTLQNGSSSSMLSEAVVCEVTLNDDRRADDPKLILSFFDIFTPWRLLSWSYSPLITLLFCLYIWSFILLLPLISLISRVKLPGVSSRRGDMKQTSLTLLAEDATDIYLSKTLLLMFSLTIPMTFNWRHREAALPASTRRLKS